MITFTISFLVSFPIKPKKSKDKSKSKKQKSKSKKPKKAKKKPKSRQKPEDSQTQDTVEPLTVEFNASNILSSFHIQYELIPFRCKYDLDVICWGPIAKILTNDGNVLVYTVIRDETIWIPICMEHYIESMSVKEIKLFYNQIIEINVSNTLQKAPAMFKTENIVVQKDKVMKEDQKTFKSRTSFKNVIGDIGAELNSDEASRLSLEHFIKNVIIKCANFPKNETVSWINDNNKFDTFYDILDKYYSGKYIKTNELIYPCNHLQKEQKDTAKSKKKKKGKPKKKKGKGKGKTKKSKESKKTVDKIVISIPAEVFFTEFSLGTFHVEGKGNFLKDIFIFVSATNLLSRSQKLALNPIVVKIFKIENFPVKQLKNLGFESIYVTYSIPEVLQCTTKERLLDDKIYFNEAHIHFMDTVPKMKLIENIQTKRFVVNIYGNKTVKEKPSDCGLFGMNPEDVKTISRIGPMFEHFVEPTKPELSVLLAVSVFDVSSIVENVWDFREIGQCHTPHLNLYTQQDYYGFKYADTKNINEISTKVDLTKNNVLPESTFLQLGTTISVEVYLMAPQAPCLVYHHQPNTFKRLFFLTENEDFAETILNLTVSHNQHVKLDNQDLEAMNKLDVLTGFLLDNGSSYFFYMEGPSTGFILNIWHMIEESCPLINLRSEGNQFTDSGIRLINGKVFFNTDNAFEKRLYSHFITVGMYMVTLKVPLQYILAIPNVYNRNKIPKPCMDALSKLSLLFDSNYYKTILQQDLLPLPQELISLNLEWGVPTRWKEFVEF